MSEVYVKTQKVPKWQLAAQAKYLHVSVQVAKQAVTGIPMRTPKGSGASARTLPPPMALPSMGKLRRQRQRLMRLAAEEMVKQGVGDAA